jgi:hypothetical protein
MQATAAIRLNASVTAGIDDVLGGLIDRDPTKTAQMVAVKPARAQPAG